ncbi:uncharacterized protein LOC113681325 isoform X3 [Pocillopora damicornis]|uniref:uncharacterized protein LOC113681325 isoform X3 n=1 Tax=Pocillopora damicornis TaxID=46731 RepID=UPI000F54F232|nr:uncharacterized protein LOC113681325 isoform X3 [Pocillopora damicornis]
MGTKQLADGRSFSVVPYLKLSYPHDGVEKGSVRTHSSSRVIFLDENGDKITEGDKEVPSLKEQGQRTSKEAKARRGSALLVKRRSVSLDAANFMAYYVNRRNSSLRRDHFLRSFGKTTLRYPNLNDEDIEGDVFNGKAAPPYIEDRETPLNESVKSFLRRTASASPVLVRPASSKKPCSSTPVKNLLELRGSTYNGEPSCSDLTAKIRKQSAKRRIKRIMEAEKEKAEREKAEEELRLKEQEKKKKKKTFRGAALALMVTNVSAAGFNFKSFSEKKKWLAEKRLWTRQIASTKFRWAVRVVVVLGRVLKALVSYSTVMVPETAAQRSFRTLRDNSEVKEMLFNKSLYQRGKSQYAYVPEWAKRILTKSAMERSENELSQLHSMLKGLTSYDKFTYRIQLAMCRAMTYLKVEHPRVVLRKGHVGVCFYFIFSGSVFVNVEELLTKTGHVMWHTAITLHRGDSFGELALLRNIKRTASVVVREDTELLMVEKNVFSKTCPRIYDKELFDKIKFCKGLSFFRHWAEEALRNVCFEAQIQEWKSNKIIVKDSSKELEWIYLCMQDVSEVLRPTGRRLMLVSKGAVMLRIRRDDFFRYSSKTTLRVARKMVQELDYPSEDIIYRSYNERCAWEQVKNTQLHSTMNSIQEKCIRHIKSFKQGTPGAKKPLTPARFSRGQSNEEEFDQYLSFVYDSHKVPGDVFESASSPFRKSTNEHLTSSTFRERTSGVNAGQPNISRKVTFSP